jgi:hypothetical protein
MNLNQYSLTGTEPLMTWLKVVGELESGHWLGLDHVKSATQVIYTPASDAYVHGGTGLTTDEINGIKTMS